MSRVSLVASIPSMLLSAVQEQHPLGALHLLDYSVHSLAEMGKPFSFTVAKFGGMTLHLAAHSEDARNRWGQVITQAAAEAAQVSLRSVLLLILHMSFKLLSTVYHNNNLSIYFVTIIA